MKALLVVALTLSVSGLAHSKEIKPCPARSAKGLLAKTNPEIPTAQKDRNTSAPQATKGQDGTRP